TDDSSASEDEGTVFDVPSVQADPLTSSYTYHSPLPSALANNSGEPCILGVDEAGRGPVLGPMVYSICYCPLSKYEQVSKLGFVDSKTLKESHRESHFRLIQSHQENIAWSVRVLSPQDISWNMLKMNKYNLNAQAHDTTIELIRQVLIKGVNVTEVRACTQSTHPSGTLKIIDIIFRPPESYKAKLSKIFPGIKITVEKKADSKYPIVSAASICAKVTRDQVLKHWTFVEKELKSSKIFGSGYPPEEAPQGSITRLFEQEEKKQEKPQSRLFMDMGLKCVSDF
ncbi:35766_t:CDS:2, partial [Gigaspora margarita]